ncbi:MAG: CopG family transcriptional regulator [Actinomycetota bacterium]
MKRTQIYLEDDQDTRLEKRARATGVTKSALIREAIDAFLALRRRPSDLEAALGETAGALPELEVPDRDEWKREYA